MEWNEIAAWLFKAGGAAVALYVANEFRKISETLKRMSDFIEELRIGFAVVGEKLGSHEKHIEKHDKRLEKLEER